jgi:hypothetical protein
MNILEEAISVVDRGWLSFKFQSLFTTGTGYNRCKQNSEILTCELFPNGAAITVIIQIVKNRI